METTTKVSARLSMQLDKPGELSPSVDSSEKDHRVEIAAKAALQGATPVTSTVVCTRKFDCKECPTASRSKLADW